MAPMYIEGEKKNVCELLIDITCMCWELLDIVIRITDPQTNITKFTLSLSIMKFVGVWFLLHPLILLPQTLSRAVGSLVPLVFYFDM